MWIESMNSFEIQCITEGLQIDMCTLLDKMELVRNLGHRSWARHRIWLGQHGQATEFRIS